MLEIADNRIKLAVRFLQKGGVSHEAVQLVCPRFNAAPTAGNYAKLLISILSLVNELELRDSNPGPAVYKTATLTY